jgi:hypothetical protein
MNPAKRYFVLSAAFYLFAAASSRNAWAEEKDRCSEVAKAGRALVTVTSDANCKLTINGEAKGTLTANRPAVQSVKQSVAKDARALCVSAENK